MQDSVFGELTYHHGWVKPMSLTLCGRTYQIECIAWAYTGQSVTEGQRQSYQRFIQRQEEWESRIETLLRHYLEQPGTGREAGWSGLCPRELVFDREGGICLMLDCAWDVENGLAVCLHPREQVGPQDLFL